MMTGVWGEAEREQGLSKVSMGASQGKVVGWVWKQLGEITIG